MIDVQPRMIRPAAMLAVACLVGCAPRGDGLQRELVELRRELGAIRAEGAALRERLDALESASGPRPSQVDPAKADASAVSDRPRLDVVRLAPGEPTDGGWVAIEPRAAALSDTPPNPSGVAPTSIRGEGRRLVLSPPASTSHAPSRKAGSP